MSRLSPFSLSQRAAEHPASPVVWLGMLVVLAGLATGMRTRPPRPARPIAAPPSPPVSPALASAPAREDVPPAPEKESSRVRL